MIKQDIHQFVGMQQDIKSPEVNSKYIYEGKNIKITSQGDNSLLHVTNIKGNKKIGDLLGVYLGHCIIGNYLVLFTTEVATESKTVETPDPGGSLTPKGVGVVSSGLNVHKEIDHIYRITISEDTESIELVELFVGNLGFSLDHPIETLGIYENEYIQKVYWVDGLNQPRVINIVAPTTKYANTSFDFIPALTLSEEVKVSKEIGIGSFMPGTIQYALTYYNKYGQESNIFYTSEILYVNPTNRGGESNENISNCFNINIKKPNTDFEFIRVYSIHRTSLDTQPTVKIVGDYRGFDTPDITGGTQSETTESSIFKIYDNGLAQAFQKKVTPFKTTYIISPEYSDVANNIVLKKEDENISLKEYVSKYQDRFTEGKYINLDITGYTLIHTVDKYTTYTYTQNPLDSDLKYSLGVYAYKMYPNPKSMGLIELMRSGLYIRDNSFEIKSTIIQTLETKYIEDKLIGMNIIDNGTIGTAVDPTVLLYLGGEDLIANTITSKDSTLFLGNLKLNRPTIQDIRLPTDNLTSKLKKITQEEKALNEYYKYSNSLDIGYSAGFKAGEIYRLGLQFQYKNGSWSEPIHITDFTTDIDTRPSIDSIPIINYTLPKKIVTEITGLGYYKVRPVVVFPSVEERTILVQGLVCPTMYNIKNRINNTPYSQSSWFTRPIFNFSALQEEINAKVEFRHNHGILLGANRGAEIQGLNPFSTTLSSYTLSNLIQSNTSKNEDTLFDAQEYFSNLYFIDQSIITLHSPDIEWNTGISNLSNKNYKFRIVGIANFTANIGDIDIQTSTPPIRTDGLGFYHTTVGNPNLDIDNCNSLVSGLFYRDGIVTAENTLKNFTYCEKDKYNKNTSWLVYPWQQSGSLNNDINRPAGEGVRSAELSKKVISNLKFSSSNTWLNSTNYWSPNNGVSNIEVFNNDQVSLSKINLNVGNNSFKSINYFGNVDSMTFPNDGGLYYGDNFTSDKESSFTDLIKSIDANNPGELPKELYSSKESVRIKYKSSPHISLGFNFTKDNNKIQQVILPSVNNIYNTSLDKNTNPTWLNIEEDISPNSTQESLDDIPVIAYRGNGNPTEASLGALYWQDLGSYSIILECTNSDPQNVTWEDVSDDYLPGKLFKYNNIIYVLHIVGQYKDSNNFTRNRIHLEKFEDYILSSDGGNNLIINNSKKFEVSQSNITFDTIQYPFLFIAELYQDANNIQMFGGNSEEALRNNTWIPAGDSITLGNDDTEVNFTRGDTWYQRYDCLKTYPFTQEDENQVVEIASFMCETRVNADGRYDKNRGQLSNLNMTPKNFNLWNPVYSQKDNFFKYRILDSDFYKLNKFPNTITWTKEKHNGEDIDTWTNITMASTLDLDGDKGKIVSLNIFNNEIYCFQESGISNIIFNAREQISTTSGVPIEISNGMKVNGKRYISNSIGCNNKWSIVESIYGIYFVDNITKGIYLLSDSVKSLSHTLNMKDYITKFNNIEPWKVNNFEPIAFKFNNDNSFNNFKVSYDKVDKKVYFVNGQDCLVYSEELGQFESFVDYQNTFSIFNIQGSTYSLYYIPTGNSGDWYTGLWKNNVLDDTNIYGYNKEVSLTVVSNQNPLNDKIFNTVEFRGNSYNKNGFDPKVCPFNKIRVWNEYQDTEDVELVFNSNTPSNLKQKFRIWRANIPRDKSNGRDRIRNTWSKIKLTGGSKKFELNDLNIHYFM